MTDDDLRAHLRRVDPAGSLPPLTPDHTEHLLEQTMSTSTATSTATARPVTRRRVPLLASAAALVLLTAGLGWALTRPTDEPPNAVAPLPAASAGTTSTAGPAGDPIALSFTDGVQAKCAEPQPGRLTTDTDFVFAGTVTSIEDNLVTLAVTRVYKGTPAATRVTITQTDDATEQLLGATTFRTNEDYLVASSAGQVLICGYTGNADNEFLQRLYDRAF